MAHLTNFSFEFVCEIFTEDVSLRLLYHGAKQSKMAKNSNQGGPALIAIDRNGFPRMKEEGHIYKKVPQIFNFCPWT